MWLQKICIYIYIYIYIHIYAYIYIWGLKNPPANAGDIRDACLIPGSGRSPEEGNGTPLQYSCLENPIDRGAWQATVHVVTQSWMTEATAQPRMAHVYTYKGVLLGHKKEWNLAIWNNKDGLQGYYDEWKKSERERQILYDITYAWNLKVKQTSEYSKKETDSQT